MPRKVRAADPEKELARLIRRSRVLDAGLKRHWLSVLPHLTAADRARLASILRAERADATPPTSPAGAES